MAVIASSASDILSWHVAPNNQSRAWAGSFRILDFEADAGTSPDVLAVLRQAVMVLCATSSLGLYVYHSEKCFMTKFIV